MTDIGNKTYSAKEIAAFEGLFSLARDGKPFSSIKVQDIATAAGIGKGTLYEYFSSKEDILSSAILYALDRILNRLEQSIDEETRFRQVLEGFFHALDDNGKLPFASLTALIASMSMEQREEIKKRNHTYMNHMFVRMQQAEARMFAIGRHSGEIDTLLDDSFCEYVILSALFGQTAAQMFAHQCPCQPDRKILVQMICRTLRP